MLEQGPLYRKYRYRCFGPVTLPDELNLVCESSKCGGFRIFKLQDRSDLDHCRYRCSNCGETTFRFLLSWDRNHELEEVPFPTGGTDMIGYEIGRVAKVGQEPEPEERISPELARQLGVIHTGLYGKAIRLRNFNAGIGALAYLRRVVEETVNELLDFVVAESQRDGRDVDAAEVQRVKAGRVFDDKMKVAKQLVPARLIPGGHNPLDKLHDLASEGLHGLSDEECCDKFDAARRVFEYFFEELPRRHQREGAFIKEVSDLNRPD
jgi:hypothetical protein